MSALVNCPRCSTRVLPMARRLCPACRKNVDSVTVVLCIIALTGDVYRNAYDEQGNLQVWGPGNKVAAVLILLIQCFFMWALITMG
jgi:hypothetical protein